MPREYGYGSGSVDERWHQLVREHASGEVVWDLGAGNGAYTGVLLDAGASGVVAVDKERYTKWKGPADARVIRVRGLFAEVGFPAGRAVAFLSFPQNNRLPGLVELLHHFHKVIYFGSNLGGSSCGNVDLFQYLTTREVLGWSAKFNASIITYGPEPRGCDALLPEEWGALNPYEEFHYGEAEAAARSAGRLLEVRQNFTSDPLA